MSTTAPAAQRPRHAMTSPDSSPTRAPDVELIGESQGSGYVDRTFLVRRSDGQVIQLSQLLYLTLEHLDGRPAEQVAADVTAVVGRELGADGVAFIVEQKLAPLGLVAAPANGRATPSHACAADAVLTLAGRRTLLRAPAVDRLARVMQPMFWQIVIVLVLEAVVVADYLAFSRNPVGESVTSVITRPAQLLAVLALMIASMLFHEVGHAAGARYGGARPGVIGMGLYVVWPAFYTDVTDAYRLGRGGRLRADLGGVYFNLVFLLALLGLHEWTGAPVFLVAAVLTHLEILQQLLPILRLDGYFIVGDLVGVPDLFRWVRPILSSLVPGRGRNPQVRRLRGWVRWVVTGWVALVVPVLAVNVWVLATTGPHLLATTSSTLQVSAHQLSLDLHTWNVVSALVTSLSMVALTLPLLGLWIIATRIGGRLRRGLSGWAARGPRHRLSVVLGIGAVVLSLAYAWLPEPVVDVDPAAAAAAAAAAAVAAVAAPTPATSLPGSLPDSLSRSLSGSLPPAASDQTPERMLPSARRGKYRSGALRPAPSASASASAAASASASASADPAPAAAIRSEPAVAPATSSTASPAGNRESSSPTGSSSPKKKSSPKPSASGSPSPSASKSQSPGGSTSAAPSGSASPAPSESGSAAPSTSAAADPGASASSAPSGSSAADPTTSAGPGPTPAP